jgi:hypothetical protein
MQKIIGKMARMYPTLILMGFMMVVISFVVGYFNAQTAATYFAEPKAVREASLLAERALIESTGLWLPYFKFSGLGLILGGIVMALKVIIDNLQNAGLEVLTNLPKDKRPAQPGAPWYGLMMPMVMMLGEVIFIVTLIMSLNLAGIAREVFSNPIAAIDAAGAGSGLLTGLATIKVTSAWLVPLKFFGVATEFLAIVMGLSTIIYILTQQTRMLDNGIELARSLKTKKSKPDSEAVADPVPAGVTN